MRRPHAAAVAAFATLVIAGGAGPASAQWIGYPTANVPKMPDGKPNLGAPAPRTADGTPDFSGVWVNEGLGGVEGLGGEPKTVFFDLEFGMGGQKPPFQPWAARLQATRWEHFGKDNPDARCLPIGPLQMLAHPLPKKILQTRGLVVFLHERNMEFRQIYTDGRPLPKDPQPAWYGYSTGHWEGDTLVVDTIGLRDELWADFHGAPLTDQAKIRERFRRTSFGTLEAQVTVDDPKAYTKPWTVTINQRLALDTDLLEYACLENEKDVPRLVGK
jgi:hypothetical protein